VVDRLPVSVSELTLSKLLHHGWIESRGEGHHMAIRLTPAGLEAMRSRSRAARTAHRDSRSLHQAGGRTRWATRTGL